MAVGADLTLVGKDVIRLVLGPQWVEAGTIFCFFGPGIGIMLLYSTIGWIHLSIGRPGRWLHWTVLEFIAIAGLIIAALHWGPSGVAVAWSLSYLILTIPGFWYAGRPIQLGISPLLASTWKYAAGSLAAECVSAAVIKKTAWLSSLSAAQSSGPALEGIVIVTGLFGALYLGAVILLHRGLAPLRETVGVLRELVPRGQPATPIPAAPAGPIAGGRYQTFRRGSLATPRLKEE
jgi:O-antigen/teichoic acid export membrane protein